MDVASRNNERGPLMLAAATLALAGVMLLYVSWRNVQRQREAVDRHMLLTAQSVLRSVEGSLRMGMGRMMGRPEGGVAFRPGMRRLLQELEESGDVLFVGVFEKQAGRIISLRDDANARRLELPPEALAALRESGEWNGMIRFGDLVGFSYGRRARRGVQRLFESHGMRHRADGGPPPPPEVFVIVGLDASEHLAVYQSFRRNAMLHTAYVLAAAMFVWFLAAGLLRRRALAGRAASLERFQSRLLDNTPDGLITVDCSGVIVSANPAAHTILGASDGELAGRSCEAMALDASECLQLNPEGEPIWKQHEVAGRSLEVLALPLPDADAEHGESGRMVLIRDRTRMRSMERSLGEAQRLAAIGRLAAGVAHEIRNPLSSLRGFAQLFAKKFSPGEPEKEYADTMVREADRLNRVITDLLFLSRPRSVEPVDVDLMELAGELERLLEMDLASHGVTLSTRFDVPVVHADRDLLKQALLNMILNAMEIMTEDREDGGEGGSEIVLASRGGDGGVEIGVQDNGPGMDPALADDVFEPFFTGRRNGTGLGLAFVRKTARDHGGEAWVDTGPANPDGRGCTVRMMFPDQDASARAADQDASPQAAEKGTSGSSADANDRSEG